MKPSIKKILERKAKLLAQMHRIFHDDGFRNIPLSKFSEYQKMRCEHSAACLSLVKKTIETLKESNYIDLEPMRDELLAEQEKLEQVLVDIKKIAKEAN